MTFDDIRKHFLLGNGWHTWYNEAAWVHPQTVANPRTRDYTGNVFTLKAAYEYENKVQKK